MLGFSAGRPILEPDKQENLKNIERLLIKGVDSIEIFLHKDFADTDEFFERVLLLELPMFNHVSLHAPDIPYGQHPRTEKVIEYLKKISEKLNAQYITLHPAGIQDWSLFKEFEGKLLLENMDPVKGEGQDVDDMNKYFSQIDAGMTLDLQHSYSIDPSMALTDRLIDTFKARIKEVHISGWESPNRHVPLYNFSDRDFIVSRLERLPGVNVVMEGVTMDAFNSPNGDEMLKSEVEFLRSFII